MSPRLPQLASEREYRSFVERFSKLEEGDVEGMLWEENLLSILSHSRIQHMLFYP